MTDARDDEDLAERVAELETTLEDLRDGLAEPSPPRGPFGLPRPPTPRELLRFTEQHAIPTAIAVLEANVRALKLLQGALRLTDPERAAREEAGEARTRAERVGRTALDRLDGALADLQSEFEDGGIPADGEARDVLRDARALSAEIRDRLATDGEPGSGVEAGRDDDPGGTDRAGTAPGGTDVPVDGPDRRGEESPEGRRAGSDADPVEIDVEGELQSIKDELEDGEGRNDAGGDAGEGDGDGDAADGDGGGTDGDDGTDGNRDDGHPGGSA